MATARTSRRRMASLELSRTPVAMTAVATGIVKAMIGNPVFATPTPTMGGNGGARTVRRHPSVCPRQAGSTFRSAQPPEILRGALLATSLLLLVPQPPTIASARDPC